MPSIPALPLSALHKFSHVTHLWSPCVSRDMHTPPTPPRTPDGIRRRFRILLRIYTISGGARDFKLKEKKTGKERGEEAHTRSLALVRSLKAVRVPALIAGVMF